jgi:hypothetical protein
MATSVSFLRPKVNAVTKIGQIKDVEKYFLVSFVRERELFDIKSLNVEPVMAKFRHEIQHRLDARTA